MSFGNFQLHRLEPSQGHDYHHSYGRRHQLGRDSESAQQLQPVRKSSTTVRAESQTNLTVVTAEGDRITISLAAQAKFAAASQTGPNGSSQTVATSASSQLRVAVEGTLSETELKDLGALINAVNKATSQAESTGVPDASAFTASFAGLESLAAFAYTYNQTVEAGSSSAPHDQGRLR
jgi:hypothetical protein